MANYSTLKEAVADVVKTNGTQAITGANLQAVLLSIINSIGGGGYIFAGVATPSTNPGTPDQNVFYIGGAGTYANFGTSVTVQPTDIAVFKYNGAWTCEQVTVDGGGVFDISSFKAVGGTLATYADLAAALGTNGANIPEGLRRGGMMVKYVQSSDNKYVIYFLTKNEWSAAASDWEKMNVEEEFSQLGQEITGLKIDINETKIDAPFEKYKIVYQGYIPIGCLIINYSPAAIGVYLVDEKNYILVDARKSFYVSTKAAVRIQTLNNPMSSGSVYILAPIEAAIKSIRPVDSLLDKSKNLFNPTAEDVSLNSYINGAGIVVPNNNYHTSGIIRIEPGKQYVFSLAGSAYSVRGIYVYAANGVLADSYVSSGTFTAKEECCFVRFYANKADFSSIQLEQAETPTSYVPYSEKIKPLYLPEIDARQKQMNAFALTGSLSSGQTLSKSINIYKGIMMSAKITGTIGNVAMGLGYNGSYGRWVEVSQTQVTLMDKNGQHATPREHGLTLGAFTTIELSKDDNTGDFTVRVINDYGEIYEWVMGNIGQAGGNPFLMNLGTSAISAKFTIFPRDLSANIWGFGDSYFSFQYTSRWPYYAITWGYDKWLINARGGEDSAEGYIDFTTLLSTGASPEYALWCYGMNDGSDGETPNAIWLSNIQAFIQDCEEHNITPILATIPTVPSINHNMKNAWVRNSGYRYIDFALYVEASGNDYWRGWGTENALLNTDKVHPTIAGGKVLWQAVLEFFPEIATNY